MGGRRCTTLRANTLRGSAEALMRFFRDNAVKYRRVPWYSDAFVLAELRERDVQAWPAYAEGRIYLQNLSSMVPALALGPRPGERVLDLAAAPGSKTTQMAALMANSGSILANDADAIRLERLAYNVRLQGCSIVEVRLGWGEKLGELSPESFDRVLLDVPCSGEGRFIVFEPATSRGWSRKGVTESVRLQKKLIASGTRALKPGGVLVYSTCTKPGGKRAAGAVGGGEFSTGSGKSAHADTGRVCRHDARPASLPRHGSADLSRLRERGILRVPDA